MSAVLGLSDAAGGAVLTALLALIDAGAGPGTAKCYTGTRAATANTAVGAQTLLGTVTLADPSGVVAGQTFTFTAGSVVSVVADGTPTWARIADSAGNTVCDVDVTISAGGGALTFDSVTWVTGGTAQVTGGTFAVAAS